jgi:hypothetical protein
VKARELRVKPAGRWIVFPFGESSAIEVSPLGGEETISLTPKQVREAKLLGGVSFNDSLTRQEDSTICSYETADGGYYPSCHAENFFAWQDIEKAIAEQW